jgi:RNA recognition motif-containing protein
MKTPISGRELYISEISFSAEEEDLRKLFVLFGTVNSVHMVKDPKSGLFKGSAFIRMATPAQAKDALSLDGTYLIDRCISVTTARPKQSEGPAAKRPHGKTPRTPQRRK